MRVILYFAKEMHSIAGRKLYVNFFSSIVLSFMESIGIFMVIPLISLTGLVSTNQNDQLMIIWITEYLQKLPLQLSLSISLAVFILYITLHSIFQRRTLINNTKIQQKYIRILREQVYRQLLVSNWEFFLKKRKSDIINLLTVEITRLLNGINVLQQLMSTLIFSLVQIIIALWLSPLLTITVLVFGVLLTFFSKGFLKKSKAIGQETIKVSEEYYATITNHFNGIKEIKSNSLEHTHNRLFRDLCSRIEEIGIEYASVNSLSQVIYKVVSGCLIAIFLYFSIVMFKASSTDFIIILIIFSRLWPKISSVQSSLQNISTLLPSFRLVYDWLIESKSSQENNIGHLEDINSNMKNIEIECQHVTFRYQHESLNYTLEDIRMEVPANRMTAIVGPSGSGKSTLVDLLMGLVKPEKGEVLVNGLPLTKDKLLRFRKSIGYVPQDPYLFSGSIRDNLLIVKENASEAEMWEALEFASAAHFVKKLEHGLNTIIGDRGIKLSGGERQRIVLARAILKKPSILVLDEATSALDTDNEIRIQEALEKLKGKLTILVIAHRLSTIRNADQVIVLEEGRIVQIGSFSQLAKEKQRTFSKLLVKQSGMTS